MQGRDRLGLEREDHEPTGVLAVPTVITRPGAGVMVTRDGSSPLESLNTVLAARRFYLENVSKSAIAQELGISRFKVARLLSNALRDKVITINVSTPSDVDVDLSLEVAKEYGIPRCLVVKALEGADESINRARFGRACADVLGDILEEQDVLGISWGRTLHSMVDVLPDLPACTVVQIVGSVPTSDLHINSLDLIRRISEKSGGTAHVLQVPLVVDDPSVAEHLRQETHVARTIGMFDQLTKAVVGIGAWRPAQSALRDAIPPVLRTALEAAGAAADICSTVLNEHGEEVLSGDVAARCISIGAAQLRRCPNVIAIVRGTARATAIKAALRSGIVHHLITDDRTARALLNL
jgi:DNA-binding transcriptional regulator LsrR (DeoR family)